MSKLMVFVVVMVLQGLTLAEGPETDSSAGVVETAKEAYKQLREKIVNAGSTVVEFAQRYYEDQVKPVSSPYVQWAKEKASSVWDHVKEKVSSYRSD